MLVGLGRKRAEQHSLHCKSSSHYKYIDTDYSQIHQVLIHIALPSLSSLTLYTYISHSNLSVKTSWL